MWKARRAMSHNEKGLLLFRELKTFCWNVSPFKLLTLSYLLMLIGFRPTEQKPVRITTVQ
jgi:hypothetical protein